MRGFPVISVFRHVLSPVSKYPTAGKCFEYPKRENKGDFQTLSFSAGGNITRPVGMGLLQMTGVLVVPFRVPLRVLKPKISDEHHVIFIASPLPGLTRM